MQANTEKRYLDDPYTAAFTATVVGADARSDGTGVDIILDQSYFYPESGGQLADAGTIAGLAVLDVQERDDGAVVHTVAGTIAEGDAVACEVDRDRRFDHMQQHTGQHVLSRAFIDTAGLHTVSFHMGDDTCTIDVAGGKLDGDMAARAEALANRIVEENRPVAVRTVPVAELDAEGLRRKVPDGVTDARLVSVEGFDVIPCCGTHVRGTGELALVKVLKWEKVRDTHRIHFKVGRRALADYVHKHEVVSELSSRFTTGTTEILSKVDKLTAENQASKKVLKALSQRLAALEGERLLETAERIGSVRQVVSKVDGDGDYARALSNALRAAGDVVAILASEDGTVVCAVSDGLALDVATPAVARATEAGGSGGGRGGFAQIRLPGGADVEAFIQEVGDHVKSML